MEFDEIKFSRKTEIELKNYELLKSVFTKIYDTENELLNKRKSIFDDITKIPETENKTLTEIYSKFTSEMKGLEEFRNNQMLIIKSKLIPATTYYSSKVKNSIGGNSHLFAKHFLAIVISLSLYKSKL